MRLKIFIYRMHVRSGTYTTTKQLNYKHTMRFDRQPLKDLTFDRQPSKSKKFDRQPSKHLLATLR